MTPEDIGDIFQELEDALFAMAIRTMKHHQNWEEEEGFKWTQWQAEQINGLRAYRQNVSALTDYHFNLAKKAIEAFLREAYEGSVSDAAGLIARYGIGGIHPGFFGVNSKKLDVLIDEAIQNIDTKRYAAINRMNSGYTDMLRKADMFAQSGSFTIPQVVDMAAKDFLSAGLNCVEYSNGNRVNIASYAEMALRTSSSEVTRQANGDVRNELGEYLVVSNVIAMTCPICQKWQGKVMIDDVYSNGKPDGKHQLVSESKADGFMHPNCRHQLFMYIEGVTNVADLPNDVQTRERYDAEQKQRYYERQIRKYKRLRDGAVDPANRQKYDARVKEWTERHDKFVGSRDYLRKNPKRLAMGYKGNGKPDINERALAVRGNSIMGIHTSGHAEELSKEVRALIDTNLHKAINDVYPELDGKIDDILFTELRNGTIMSVPNLDESLTHVLKIDYRFLETVDTIKECIEEGNPMFSPKSSLKDYFVHELTHILEDLYNIRSNTVDGVVQVSAVLRKCESHEYALQLIREAFRRCSIEYNDDNIRKYISNYATYSASEAVAEACSSTSDNVICKMVRKLVLSWWRNSL